MRRAVFILLTVCLVLCFIDALALDYSQYEIRNRFTMDVNLLRDGEFVAETWEDRYGDVRNSWHVTWWKDDHILREVDHCVGPCSFRAASVFSGGRFLAFGRKASFNPIPMLIHQRRILLTANASVSTDNKSAPQMRFNRGRIITDHNAGIKRIVSKSLRIVSEIGSRGMNRFLIFGRTPSTNNLQ